MLSNNFDEYAPGGHRNLETLDHFIARRAKERGAAGSLQFNAGIKPMASFDGGIIDAVADKLAKKFIPTSNGNSSPGGQLKNQPSSFDERSYDDILVDELHELSQDARAEFDENFKMDPSDDFENEDIDGTVEDENLADELFELSQNGGE